MEHINRAQNLNGSARPALTSELAFNSVVPWNNEIFLSPPTHRRHGEAIQPGTDEMDFREAMGAMTRVCIGTSTFWCTSSLLQCHSNYFYRYICPVNCFREGIDLIAVGFRSAYTWMRRQERLDPFMQPDKLMTLLHTAVQLEMPALKALCYEQLCTDRFREESAFQVYLRALKYAQLEELRKLMLQRIGAAFLSVLGSDDFLRMPVEDVMTMLQQGALGVNTELEVLVAIIRWLSCQTKCIATAAPQLLGCLRFTLLPMAILQKLWLCAMTPPVPDEPFMNVVRSNIHIRERISCAITVAQVQQLHTRRRDFLAFCRSKCLLVDVPREWIYDEECPYHLPRPGAPYTQVVCAEVISKYAIEKAQQLTETVKRWPRRACTYLPPSDDLQTISELPEDKDDEQADIFAWLSAPELPEWPPLPEDGERYIIRHFRGIRLLLNEMVDDQHRTTDYWEELGRRIQNLEREGASMPGVITTGASRLIFPTAMTYAAQEAAQEERFRNMDSELRAKNLDTIDAYYFLHVCRMKLLVPPKANVSTENSTTEEHVRPMESFVLDTERMIEALPF
ncbi:GD16301 [Drosophila simulans]|uniref:GD16301 n=1 Tax=Drosophila simulans TaxID=7240 RepID=B4R4G9_DROSI|nr:GD16301 [Drosophila simulans]